MRTCRCVTKHLPLFWWRCAHSVVLLNTCRCFEGGAHSPLCYKTFVTVLSKVRTCRCVPYHLSLFWKKVLTHRFVNEHTVRCVTKHLSLFWGRCTQSVVLLNICHCFEQSAHMPLCSLSLVTVLMAMRTFRCVTKHVYLFLRKCGHANVSLNTCQCFDGDAHIPLCY